MSAHKPITLDSETVEAILTDLEQVRDLLREEPLDSGWWPMSWRVEGIMLLLRGVDPQTGQPIT